MDPTRTLDEMRRLAADLLNGRHGVRVDAMYGMALAQHFHTLDSWLERGGFYPEQWDHMRQRMNREAKNRVRTATNQMLDSIQNQHERDCGV